MKPADSPVAALASGLGPWIMGFVLVLAAHPIHSQTTPEISAWIVNTTGQLGYKGILTNVQKVQYSADNVYVSAA